MRPSIAGDRKQGTRHFQVRTAFVILKRTTNGPRAESHSESFSMPSPTVMDRRDFLKLAGAAAAAGPLAGHQTQMPTPMTPTASGAKRSRERYSTSDRAGDGGTCAHRIVSTIGYTACPPGPLLRMKEGVPSRSTYSTRPIRPSMSFSRTADSGRRGRFRRGRYAAGAAAWQPQLQIHADARGHALVSHVRDVDGRSAPGTYTGQFGF